MSEIMDGLQNVVQEMNKACKSVHRKPSDVCLVAVSKTKPADMIREAYEAGVRDFGENKVQELCDKMERLPKDIRWHMIGHLQRNKVKYIVGKVALIHSVDSMRLAAEISRLAVMNNVCQDILIQVNVAREETKFGVTLEETMELVREVAKLPNIHICGLMTSAPYVEDPDENLPIFHKMSQLAVDIRKENIDNVDMKILSMGMSQDYVAAIKEGSTMIRVGSKIFGQRYYTNSYVE
ncbi:MAG: YggS family pyridoxal phosphate-dependent enzyme [Lachnospiraceae bacterium]|jgi:hypothetical protein|nr:YggS family pyridoxal phosphate-dependent enzyme [Lachnospiraceae bacterium]